MVEQRNKIYRLNVRGKTLEVNAKQRQSATLTSIDDAKNRHKERMKQQILARSKHLRDNESR
jgi:hypothetical protein